MKVNSAGKISALLLSLLFLIPTLSESKDWVYYNSSNSVMDIALSNNFLWTLTTTGIIRRDINSNSAESIYVPWKITSINANGDKVLAIADGSLLKYDGTSFVDHELTSEHPEFTGITSMAIEMSGVEWFLTSEGVSRYDGDILRTYTTDNDLYFNVSSSITTGEDGIVWKVTHYSLRAYKPAINTTDIPRHANKITGSPPYGAEVSMFNGETWEIIRNFEPIDGGYTIKPAMGPENKLYMYVSTIYDDNNGSILTYGGSTWNTITLGNFPHAVVHSMDIDIETNKAIFGFDNYLQASGVAAYDLATNPAREIELGLTGFSVRKCLFGPDNKLWAVTDESFFCYENGDWIQLNMPSFAGTTVTSYIEDSEGSVWFGTRTGVSRIKNGFVDSFYSEDFGLNEHILKVTLDKNGKVWIVTSDGIARYENGQWISYPLPDGENTGFIHFGNSGDIWLNRDTGIYIFDGSLLKQVFNGLILNTVVASDGTVWTVHNHRNDYNALYRFDGHEPIRIPSDGIRLMNFTLSPSGDVWVLDGSYFKAHCYHDGEWITYTQEDGVPFDANAIYFKNDDIWISSEDGGVAGFEVDHWRYYIPRESVPKGLRGMLLFDDGTAWTWGEDGVSKFNGESWEFVRDAFGLTYNYTYQGTLAPDGSIWFATQKGLMKRFEDEWISVTDPDIGYSSGLLFDSSNTLWFIAQNIGVASYSDNPVYIHDNSLNPDTFSLIGNYPNPFNPSTTISFTLPETDHAKLSVYSITGQMIANLVDERLSRGNHKINFDAKGLPSGAYFYRLVTGSGVKTGKILLLR
ncbi:T9SS type A sorting domain-containing protein [Candidatus Latescibacterota bacterium]